MNIKFEDLLTIHKIDTGYAITYKQPQGDGVATKAFHDATTRDERLQLLSEVIKVLGLKHDFEIVSRRTQSV